MTGPRSKALFSRGHAERLKVRAGEPYRPANGTEGEMFAERWCDSCTLNGGCDVYAAAFFYDVDAPEYPAAWVYGPDGQPVCTAFVDADPDAEPAVVPLPGQLSLFGESTP